MATTRDKNKMPKKFEIINTKKDTVAELPTTRDENEMFKKLPDTVTELPAAGDKDEMLEKLTEARNKAIFKKL